jgi:hypothetical protein
LLLQIEAENFDFDLYIEIKVHSSESGDQLNNYKKYIANKRSQRAFLATLSKTHLREDIPSIRWQNIWDSIAISKTISPYWLDFQKYLEEIWMADQYNRPVEISEVNSFSGTFSLLRKSLHILQPVAEHTNKIWPQGNLPTDPGRILDMTARQFVFNRFTIYTSFFKAGLVLGLANFENTINLAIWIERDDPIREWLRSALIERADQGGLSSDWQRIRELAKYEVVLAKKIIDSDASIEFCSNWLIGKVDELHSAGILNLIPQLTQG